jgi:hypothetical protein
MAASLLKSVEEVDLSRIKWRLEMKLEWTSEETDAALLEYRRFLHLVVISPGPGLAPSKKVDEVWHAHILHTREYLRDCHSIAGRFIHHQPARPKSDVMHSKLAYIKTLEMYRETFGVNPPANVWPEIVATDPCSEMDCSAIECRSECPTCNARCDEN